jgi:dipeptidyl aminopeptidase/acylaminoacyl peptidase
MGDDGIQLASELGLPPGRYALPDTATPTQLVVMFHGHQNDSCSWRNHLREVAARGAIAVAMDYTGQVDQEVEGFGRVENWGWFVRSGAADSITAARHFMDRYPSITQVFNLGASMGGNVSGYAAYSPDAVRADCSPLWDYWIATEGVHNLTEEYTGARALAPANPTAAQAQLEIEQENGGTLEEVPERYAEITNVAHADAMAYLVGAVFVHGTSDSTVPFDQSRQMTDNLRAAGVPVHLYPVVGSDHVWEGNSTAQVMGVGLEELYRLMAGGTVEDGETPVGP